VLRVSGLLLLPPLLLQLLLLLPMPMLLLLLLLLLAMQGVQCCALRSLSAVMNALRQIFMGRRAQ
jgi:hypothetical protein